MLLSVAGCVTWEWSRPRNSGPGDGMTTGHITKENKKIIKHIVVIFSFNILLNQLQTLTFFYNKKSLHKLFCALFEHLLPDKKMTFSLKVIHVWKNFSATSMENDSNRYLLNYTSVSFIKLINKMITITAKIQHIN